jgi:uncharacterized repeat protein (TIGR01451 family)
MGSARATEMKRTVRYILAAFLALAVLVTLMERSASAAGTPAGVTISSPAIATFDYGGIPQPPITASTSFVVDRKINLVVTPANGVYVGVNPGSASQVLTFTVMNTGNSAQDFSLAAVHGADPFGGIDNFNAANVRVFVESGATPGYQTAEDTGTYVDELAADSLRTVYIVADIPGAQISGDISALSLVATARSGGAAGILGGAVAETVGPNDPAAVDTVFADAAGPADGVRDGAHSAASAYRVASAALSLVKSAAVTSAGGQPVTGATIRYTITATVTGAGTAAGVVVSDPIPPNTTAVAGTLRLNNGLLTDAADADAGDVNATTAGTVTVKLGDLNNASPVQTITFEVKIN